MDEIYCNGCGERLSMEPIGTPHQPCPTCGSTSRRFDKYLEASNKPSASVMATTLRDKQPIGFTESANPDLTRYASLNHDSTIRLNLRGLAPSNEQDSDLVCTNLITVLNANGLRVKLMGRGEQDDDFVLVINGSRIGVQVVRALTEPNFWMHIANTGEVNELRLSISEAVSALKKAIEHKTKIPPKQRSTLILLLDAYRLPALALGPVTNQFRIAHSSWMQALGFYAVYIVGPEPNFVSRLDQ